MAEPPICPNPKCRKPMTFLGDAKDGSYQFGCYACGAGRVVSAPQTIDAAKHKVAQERLDTTKQVLHDYHSRRKSYSFGGKR